MCTHLGLPWPKCNTLHLALLNLIRFTWAHKTFSLLLVNCGYHLIPNRSRPAQVSHGIPQIFADSEESTTRIARSEALLGMHEQGWSKAKAKENVSSNVVRSSQTDLEQDYNLLL